DVLERLVENLASPHWILDAATPLAAQLGPGVLSLDQLPQLLQAEPEQVLQPQQFGEPLDVGLRVGSVGAALAPADRWQQPDLLVVADRPRGGAGEAGDLADSQLGAHGVASISSEIASSTAAKRLDWCRVGSWARSCRGRNRETPAPSTEVAARTQRAV